MTAAPTCRVPRSHDIVTGEFDDHSKLARFARGVDVVTFDWENVPVASARAIARIRPVWPPPRALEVAQDRLAEKRLFLKLGIPRRPVRSRRFRTRPRARDRRRSARPASSRRGGSAMTARARCVSGVARDAGEALDAARRPAAHLRTLRQLLARSLAHRRARPRGRDPELPARRERRTMTVFSRSRARLTTTHDCSGRPSATTDD